MGIFLALIAFLGWGTGGLFSTLTSRKFGSVKALFWQLLFTSIIAGIYIPFAPQLHDGRIIVIAVILAFINLLGFLSWFKGVTLSNPSLVTSISYGFPAVSVILSLIFLNEKVTLFQLLVIVFMFIGIFLILFKFSDIKNLQFKNIAKDKGLLLAILSMFLFGIYGAFVKIPASVIGWFWPIYFFDLMFIVLFIYALVSKVDLKLNLKKDKIYIFFIFLSLLCETSAQFAYSAGVIIDKVSLVAPITGSAPVLLVILTRIIFKEKISKQQTYGIIITLLGIIFLSLSSI